MKNLNQMCYTDYIEYLNDKKINYTEEECVDIDVFFTTYVKIIPAENKLKERCFSNDGGWQLVYS